MSATYTHKTYATKLGTGRDLHNFILKSAQNFDSNMKAKSTVA